MAYFARETTVVNRQKFNAPLSEAELIQQLRNDQPAACKALVALYGSMVFNTALGLLQHHADAEDIAQEVFAQAFQSIGQFRGDAKLSTWLYRIAVTKSLDFLRAKKRQKRFGFLRSIFEPGGIQLAVDPAHFQHPEVQMENRERAAILFQAIEKLPEKQKTAFILSKLEDLPYVEIAEVMQTTVASVESLLFRAKQNLQKLLGEYYEKNER